MFTSVKTNRGTESAMSKPKETSSDQYRVCRCNFKVKFGTAAPQPSKTDYITSENLFKAIYGAEVLYYPLH